MAEIKKEQLHLVFFQQLTFLTGQMATVPQFVAVFNDVTAYFHGRSFTLLDSEGPDEDKAGFANHVIGAMQTMLNGQCLRVRTAFLASAPELHSCQEDRMAYGRLLQRYFPDVRLCV